MLSLRVDDDPVMGWLLTCEAAVLSFLLEGTRVVVHLRMEPFRRFVRERLFSPHYRIVAAENPRHTTLSLLLPWKELVGKPFACFQDLNEVMRSCTGLPDGFDPGLFTPEKWVPHWLEKQQDTSCTPAQALTVRQMQTLTERVRNPGSMRAIAKCRLPWVSEAVVHKEFDAGQLEMLRQHLGRSVVDNVLRNAAVQRCG